MDGQTNTGRQQQRCCTNREVSKDRWTDGLTEGRTDTDRQINDRQMESCIITYSHTVSVTVSDCDCDNVFVSKLNIHSPYDYGLTLQKM